jgi:hypothetical protein
MRHPDMRGRVSDLLNSRAYRRIGKGVHKQRGRDVARFAKDKRLAHLIETRARSAIIGAANFHVGSDYRLRISSTAWFIANGELIKRKGVEPEIERANAIESLRSGRDIPMRRPRTFCDRISGVLFTVLKG